MASKYTTESFIEKVKDIWGDKWTFLEPDKPFQGVHYKIRVFCNDCKTEQRKRANDLLHGHGCAGCKGTTIKTNEQYKEIIKEITNGEYELISNHDRTRDKATFRHYLNNGEYHDFEMRIHNFITLDQRCPFCKKIPKSIKDSKGSVKIRKFLESQNIDFIQEKRFNDCRGKKSNVMLSFDFFIPSLNIMIEYDGQQHFDNKWFNQTKEEFERRKQNDETKNQYCLNNNYKLIRIPYTKYTSINKILEEELK